MEFAQRNLLLVQGNLLRPFLYIELLPLTSNCKDCPVGPHMDIAKENSTKTLWISPIVVEHKTLNHKPSPLN